MFSQAFLYNDLKIDNELILKKLNNLEFKHTELTQANGANCQISIKRNILDIDEFIILKEKIKETIEFYIKNICIYEIDFKIYSSWATRTPPKIGFSHRHSHPNSWISGVYYPEETTANIRLHTPYKCSWDIGHPKKYNEYNSDCFDVDIKTNRLIVFNSFLEHEITLNKEDKNRYSIAFNVLPCGKIGKGDSEVIFG